MCNTQDTMTGELLKDILLSQDFEKYIVTLQAQNYWHFGDQSETFTALLTRTLSTMFAYLSPLAISLQSLLTEGYPIIT